MKEDSRHEAARLAALAAYNILDTPVESEFDELTQLAAQLCKTPIALISLLDENRQWFKSRVGLGVSETPKVISFCIHTIQDETPLVVENALRDERFAHNPLVQGEPYIRFYAGVPLTVPSGYRIGTLCVIAPSPKTPTDEQLRILQLLGRQVVRQLELKRTNAALSKSESHLRLRSVQQAAIARIGQLGIATRNINEFMNACVDELADVLGVEYSKVLEHWPEQSVLLLRAGVGWKTDLIGQATVADSLRSQAGYTLASSQPIVVEDLGTETRFSGPQLLIDHGVVSGVSVLIPGTPRPFGVVGIHTRHHRTFSDDDVNFVQSVANILASAIERHQIETMLSQSETRFRSLVDTAPVGIFLTNAAGQCEFVNDRWQQITGLSSSEAAGDGWSEALHPDDRARIWAEWATATDHNQEFSSEYRFLKQQQETVWVTGRAIALRDESGTITGYLGTVTDISAQKAAEIALRQSEAKLQEQAALLDVTTDAILVRDIEGRIVFWNKGAEVLYGWSAEEVLGQLADQILCLDNHHDDDLIYQSLEQNGCWQGERQQVTQSGQSITVMSRWTQVVNEQGQLTAILTVNTDITETKALEAQFLRAQRLESIGTLASGIAHDLNNILTPIYGVAQLLPLQFPDADEQIQHQFEILQDSAKRGSEIIRQVLSFSKGAQGDRVPVAIKHVIAEIKSLIKKTFPKSIEVSVDIARDLNMVMGDVTQLHQVFMNFFVNARDAMPDGGKITLSGTNVVIDDSFAATHLEAQPGSYILMTVADTGVGIPPEQLDRIFEPFFTTKQAKGGTGLGLSTVHGLIKNHGGFITVHSEVDHGTQFNIYLPATGGQAEPDKASIDTPRGNGECILVVDDEAPIRQITSSILENYGYRVIVAEDGAEAIAKYAQNKAQSHLDEMTNTSIQLVLMDMMMPDLSSAKTIQILQKIDPALKVIIVSGLPSNQNLAASMGEHVKAFIQKPYSSTLLLDTIHDVIKGS